MSEADKIITKDEYELTNLSLEGYYIVKLKNGNTSKIYREGNRDYIVIDDTKYYLDKEVQKIVLSNIREYERYVI